MGRKKKVKAESASKAIANAAVEIAASESAPTPEVPASVAEVPAPKKEEPKPAKEDKVGLEDFALRHVRDYKAHWLPSILKFAESCGVGSNATPAKCREVLLKWGAVLK